MNRLLVKISRELIKRKFTISVCESCTGGMLGSIITGVPGSSRYFKGGIIAYANEIKERIVGIKRKTLKRFGAVSKETAQEMARGVRKRLKTDIGIGITGIAGPSGGTKKKPVGLVFIAIDTENKLECKQYHFKGSRNEIRKKSCINALKLLHKILTNFKISL